MGFFKQGRLYPLAVTSATRSPSLPAVPTMIESGLPGFEATAWYCMMAPAGTPRPIIDVVRVALIKALDTPQVKQRLFDEGAAAESSTPEELGAFIKAEIDKWEKAVKLAGVKLD